MTAWRRLSIGLFLSLWFMPATALADSPTAFVKSILDRVLAIQNEPAAEAVRAQRIRQIIRQSFDFEQMSRDSLGSAYQRLSPGQRQEFQTVFSALFQDSYTRMVLNFLKQEKVKYQQERQDNNRAQVKTSLVRTNETIQVDYLMHRQAQNWLLYDAIVDGVSILNNYKSQFARVMESKSFDFLMGKLKVQARALD
jgi:phospholipid transport system substrate-binding protein